MVADGFSMTYGIRFSCDELVNFGDDYATSMTTTTRQFSVSHCKCQSSDFDCGGGALASSAGRYKDSSHRGQRGDAVIAPTPALWSPGPLCGHFPARQEVLPRLRHFPRFLMSKLVLLLKSIAPDPNLGSVSSRSGMTSLEKLS